MKEIEQKQRQTRLATFNKSEKLPSRPHRKFDKNAEFLKSLRKPEGLTTSQQKIYKSKVDRLNMRMLQIQEQAVIPKKPFRRLVREIADEVGPQNLRWQP